MKTKLSVIAAAVLLAQATLGQESVQPPDAKKTSYALGMNLADVQQGKPTKLQPAELHAIFKQEEDFARAKTTARDKADGEAFLAKNAASPGVTVLPDGLQYRVLQAGDGPTPKINDAVVVKYRGTLTDGTEFDHGDHVTANLISQMRGWQEALLLMKTGSKWQIFLPPSLAYGRNWMRKVGPESTVIFEIELVSIAPPSAQSNGPNVITQ